MTVLKSVQITVVTFNLKITLDGSDHIKQFQTVRLDFKQYLNLKILTCNNVRNTSTHTYTHADTVQIRFACVSWLPISGIEALDSGRQPSDRTLHHGGLWKVLSSLPH